ncbi:methyl-accepting chemotaxis protein [Synechococcus sp. PCC 7502]|uniref:methyl-accepting chemotaxis protein n=1 Tax=Synechococcus sp. PCC 7502 TaxID=1173263 RepID=UPI00029F8E65|nr:methyl-accepting chemotaxis protein [Synechococcus sp. PCC 7502]AFY73101.1 methyl-accepting chemotaxis protein [Synechococcus sp. PCC 7502]
MGKRIQSAGVNIFQNRLIGTKLNIALGVAGVLTLLGISLAGLVAEHRQWEQLENQEKSKLATLAEGFNQTSSPITISRDKLPDSSELSSLRGDSKSVLIVDQSANVTASLGTVPVGSKFDPSGLVSKALASGTRISVTDLTSENSLVNYTVTPIKNQNILGAIVGIKPVDTQASTAGISKALLEFTAIATPNDLANPKLSPTFPIKIAKEASSKTTVEEFKIEGQSFLIAGAPILNYAGKPIAVFIHGHKYQPPLIFVQVIGIGFIFLIIGYVFALSIVTEIIKSIQKLERSAREYSRGNLTTPIKVSTQDEIGTLANLFNNLIAKLQNSEIEQAEARAQVQAQTIELEDEVGDLLDVVSDLESGNLTVQAQVTDQATGLVADTLNRLIEQLANIMSTVLSTAQQVTQGADSLEQLATSVTQNAQLQSESVAQATKEIENINQLATTASEEAIAANIAVKSAQSAVSLGQEEITKLNNSIALLQEGTTQIVQRLKTLGEFVDLAKQFVQDQKRLSSLTQVVAMNASMIAARAVEQKEPDQFASVAREFEAIASQVNNLATQTSQGLVVLQQRTGFIEIVVSGISQDIKDVTDYVSEFTTGVEQSSQAFKDIKDVTEQVAALGDSVLQSSQEIAVAVQSGVDSIQEIAALAQRSASQSNLTLERSAQMGQLARRLLNDVRFFQLPADKIPQNFLFASTNDNLKEGDN